MSSSEPVDRQRRDLAERIRRAFPTDPIPPYPELMGLDPLGETDEYAGFANTAWPDVQAEHFQLYRYDIGPTIGFGMQEPPHMWNYHLPGFMTASLCHERADGVIDFFLWKLREVEPVREVPNADAPWWGGAGFAANYAPEQVACVVDFLRLVREFGDTAPLWFDWEPQDDRMLERWVERARES